MTREGSPPLLCLALALSGCIFAEPPDRNPQQTPVMFDLGFADPLPTQLVHFDTTDPPRLFTVPFTSEDAGEEVWWVVHENLNVGGDSNQREGPRTVDPSTLLDTSRAIRFSFRPSVLSKPCLQLTLMACHRSSYDQATYRCRPDARYDTAFAVWWITYGDDLETASLADCPQESGPP